MGAAAQMDEDGISPWTRIKDTIWLAAKGGTSVVGGGGNSELLSGLQERA